MSHAAAVSSAPVLTSSENMTRDELLLANRRLQQDNEWIKGELYKLRLEQRMSTSKQQAAAKGGEGNSTTSLQNDAAEEVGLEVLSYVNQLRVDGATIIRQHEELLDLRQRCTFYANALEETSAHVDTLKQLLVALQAKTTS